MADVDLLFSRAPNATSGSIHLVFNEAEDNEYSLVATLPGPTLSALCSSGHPEVDYSISGAIPGPTLTAHVGTPLEYSISGTLPAPSFSANVTLECEYSISGTLPGPTFSAACGHPYDYELHGTIATPTLAASVTVNNACSRPTVGHVQSQHQVAAPSPIGVQHLSQISLPNPAGAQQRNANAVPTQAGIAHRGKNALPTPAQAADRAAEAVRVQGSVRASHGDALRGNRLVRKALHQNAVRTPAQAITARHQEMLRHVRPRVATRHAEGVPYSLHRQSGAQSGTPYRFGRVARHQEARRPPAGMWVPPEPPGPTPCYTPSTHLVYSERPAGTSLLFICENHDEPPPPEGSVVVPVRSVYIVLNNISLRRVDGDTLIPTLSMSLSIDVDSWTWGFNAQLPAAALADVQSGVDDQPIELEASINGNLYRVLAENIASDRQFGSHTLRVGGRGKSALLGAPYAPVQSFSNTGARTAQQLMGDVLMLNGVPLGWDVDWQLTDWLVPAGAFSANGSYIDGLNAIVGAAGGYLQPHATNLQLHALARYPVAPWDWGGVTPDFELPAAVTARESIEWHNKPAYNRVYVSGTRADSLIARVTRAASAADMLAPMVTDGLITHVDAARQRGLSVLADTGRQARVGLRLPILAETGVITPGKFVRYVDGGTTRIGMVRSTSVETGFTEAWQSLSVETHV